MTILFLILPGDLGPLPRKMASLMTLPLEIQLQIFEYCLVSESPISANYNFGEIKKENEDWNQGEICKGILSTCRSFHRHGLNILMKKKTLRLKQGVQRPTVPWIFRGTPFLWLLRHATICYDRNIGIETPLYFALNVVSAVDQAPNLQMLQIAKLVDAFPRTFIPTYSLLDDTPDEARWQCRRLRHRPSFATGQLKRITLTGLESNHPYLIALQILATLLHEQGTIDIGINDPRSRAVEEILPEDLRGTRYLYRWKMEVLEPDMKHFGKSGIGDWIQMTWMELGESTEYMYDDYQTVPNEEEDFALATWLDLDGISLEGCSGTALHICKANPIRHYEDVRCWE